MYPKDMTEPMRQELSLAGVKDLNSDQVVSEFFNKSSTTSAVLVNSVCGCAAGTARPAFIKSLELPNRPEQVGTVFAGVDQEAVAKAREYFDGYPPSSPAMAFFRDRELVYFLERSNIEGVDADSLTKVIGSIYEKFFQDEIRDDLEVLNPFSLLEIDVNATKQELEKGEATLLDCRSLSEREIASIEPSTLLSQELADEMVQNWDRDRRIIIFCHHGNRSLQAVNYFKKFQFNNVLSMKGGIQAWSETIDSGVPTY